MTKRQTWIKKLKHVAALSCLTFPQAGSNCPRHHCIRPELEYIFTTNTVYTVYHVREDRNLKMSDVILRIHERVYRSKGMMEQQVASSFNGHDEFLVRVVLYTTSTSPGVRIILPHHTTTASLITLRFMGLQNRVCQTYSRVRSLAEARARARLKSRPKITTTEFSKEIDWCRDRAFSNSSSPSV